MSSLARIVRWSRSVRTLRRTRRILAVLARHGFADAMRRSGVSRFFRGAKRVVTLGLMKPKRPLNTGERMRQVCEELGPTFVKFGQVLAGRVDLLPEQITRELAKLQDRVPPFSSQEVETILTHAFPDPATFPFASVEKEALAAASIAQVHRARLITGEEVVIKVRRPGIQSTIEEDLQVLHAVAVYLEESMEETRIFQPIRLVDEFARTLRQELDFRGEVRNLIRFAANFADEPLLKIPKPYPELCRENLIVMEYVAGVRITELKRPEDLPLAPEEFSSLGIRILIRSIFEHRFFHADPHPGNFLVTPDGLVCLLDFGMMGYIEESRMEELLSFFVGVVTQNSEMLADSLLRAGLVPSNLDVKALRRDLDMLLSQFAHSSLSELRMDLLIRSVTDTILRHHVTLPADLMLVGRAMGTMESIARRINPGFVPIQQVQPMLISTFLRHGLDPSQAAGKWVDTLFCWESLFHRLPADLTEVVRRLKEGELTIRTDERQARLERLEANRRTNRAVGTAFALGGLAVAMAAYSTQSAPDWLCLTAAITSGLVGLWVTLGLLRSGGM